jgi:uncharacterized protein YcbK (DUF882 family)
MTSSDIIGKFKKDFDALNDDLKEQYLKNATLISSKASELLSAFGKDMPITSGWRPLSYNLQVGGSKNSKHISCLAVDLHDPDKKLGEWCVANIERLKEVGIYMESLATTHASSDPKKRWVHWQCVAPKSGSIIFNP